MMTTRQPMNTYLNTKNPMKEIEMEMASTKKRTNERTDGGNKKTKSINRSICFGPRYHFIIIICQQHTKTTAIILNRKFLWTKNTKIFFKSLAIHHSPSVRRYVMIIICILDSFKCCFCSIWTVCKLSHCFSLVVVFQKMKIIFHLNFCSFCPLLSLCSFFKRWIFFFFIIIIPKHHLVLAGRRLFGIRWAYHIHWDFIHIMTRPFRLHRHTFYDYDYFRFFHVK